MLTPLSRRQAWFLCPSAPELRYCSSLRAKKVVAKMPYRNVKAAAAAWERAEVSLKEPTSSPRTKLRPSVFPMISRGISVRAEQAPHTFSTDGSSLHSPTLEALSGAYNRSHLSGTANENCDFERLTDSSSADNADAREKVSDGIGREHGSAGVDDKVVLMDSQDRGASGSYNDNCEKYSGGDCRRDEGIRGGKIPGDSTDGEAAAKSKLNEGHSEGNEIGDEANEICLGWSYDWSGSESGKGRLSSANDDKGGGERDGVRIFGDNCDVAGGKGEENTCGGDHSAYFDESVNEQGYDADLNSGNDGEDFRLGNEEEIVSEEFLKSPKPNGTPSGEVERILQCNSARSSISHEQALETLEEEQNELEEQQVQLDRVARRVNSDCFVRQSEQPSTQNAEIGSPNQYRAASDSTFDIPKTPAIFVEGNFPRREQVVLDQPSVIAVLGAESFLGTYVTEAILRGGRRKVKALVCSEEKERSRFLTYLCGQFGGCLQVEDIGPLALAMSQINLIGALRGVNIVVNCATLFSRRQPGRAADQALASVKNLSRALNASGSSVTRLVHSGSDLAVWNPCNSALDYHIDESCWFSFSDQSGRKYTHPEAYAVTAAEMYLWSEASDTAYSMVVVNSSILLGPGLAPFHAEEPGMQLIVNILSDAFPPSVLSPIVDVRDVASLISNLCVTHLDVCGRIIASTEILTTNGLAAKLRSIYADCNIKSRRSKRRGKSLWRKSPADVGIPYMLSREGVKERTRKSRLYEVSTHRAISEVGATFRPVGESVRDCVEFLHSSGFIDMGSPDGRPGRYFSSPGMRSARLSSRFSSQRMGKEGSRSRRRSKLRSSSLY